MNALERYLVGVSHQQIEGPLPVIKIDFEVYDAIVVTTDMKEYFKRIDTAKSSGVIRSLFNEFCDKHVRPQLPITLNLGDFGKRTVIFHKSLKSELRVFDQKNHITKLQAKQVFAKKVLGALSCLRKIIEMGSITKRVPNTHTNKPTEKGQDFCYFRAVVDVPEIGLTTVIIGIKKLIRSHGDQYVPYFVYVQNSPTFIGRDQSLNGKYLFAPDR